MDAIPGVAPFAKGAGTILQSLAQVQTARAASSQGEAIKQAKDFEAGQLVQRAGQTRAASQRDMLAERKNERLVQSRLQAVAAASGGGASDPTVANLAGDIAAEGNYRALTALFKGKELSNALLTGAAVKRYEGAEARRAGLIRRQTGMLAAGGTLLGGASAFSFGSKFGEPNAAPWQDPDLMDAPLWINPDDQMAGP